MKTIFLLLVFIFCMGPVHAQDPFDVLEDWDEQPLAVRTFRSLKVVNMHSVEIPHQDELIFTIGHRFGNIRTGIYEFFGLDNATIRMGFDYGINRWLGVGIGRSTFEKTYDLYGKARLITQEQTGSLLSLTYYVAGSQATIRDKYPSDRDNFAGRLTVTQKLMAGRMFSEAFSMQISTIWLLPGYLTETGESASKLSLGIATRLRLTPMTHLNLEYIPQIIDEGFSNTNPFSIGFDIETGGHVFQLFFSNTQGIADKAYLVNTRGRWQEGDIFFGFTITRVFYL